jgi:hypothetical protein
MGWESEGMLRVYYDPRIDVTDDSGLVFSSSTSAPVRTLLSGNRAGPPGPFPFGPSCCVDYVYTCEDIRKIASE